MQDYHPLGGKQNGKKSNAIKFTKARRADMIIENINAIYLQPRRGDILNLIKYGRNILTNLYSGCSQKTQRANIRKYKIITPGGGKQMAINQTLSIYKKPEGLIWL